VIALAALGITALSKEIEDGKYALAFYPYAANELTKTEIRSRFWGTRVIRKSTQILSRLFRLNTIKGDEEEGITRNAEGSYTVLKQLNICPA
jgi:hypothetical protein